MNTHQKHGFLMCVVTMCIKNGGFLCMSGATCTKKRSFAARPVLADYLKKMGVVWN